MWKRSTNYTIDDASLLEPRLNDVEGKVTDIENNHKEQASTTQSLVHGQNVINASQSGPLKVEFYPEHRVNLLGKIGNFETDSNADGVADGWTGGTILFGATATLETSNVKYGTKAQRITSTASDTSTNRRIQKLDIKGTAGKYYVALVDLVSDGVATGELTFRNSTTANTSMSSTTSKTLYVKFAPTTTEDMWIQLYNKIAVGQVGWTQYDGVRIYEIDQSIYDKIDDLSLTGDDVEYVKRNFPYVDSIQSVKNPVLKVSGSQLFNIGTVNENATKTTNEISFSGTTGWHNSFFDWVGGETSSRNVNNLIELVGNQAYTISGEKVSGSSLSLAIYDKNGVHILNITSSWTLSNPLTFTTPNQNKVYLDLRNVKDSFHVKNIMLNLGSTSKPYTDYNPSYLYAETSLYGNSLKKDILSRNYDFNRWEKIKNWEQVNDLASLEWVYSAGYSTSDYKAVQAKLPTGTNAVNGSAIASKYDGKILNLRLGLSGLDSHDLVVLNTSYSEPLTITISNADATGYDLTTSTGIKQYFTDKNYFLLYQLANSEIVPLDNGEVEGDLSISGDTQISVTSGFSYTTDSEGNRIYTLTPDDQRYAETANLNDVRVTYSNSLKSSFDRNNERLSDAITELTIHDRQILDIMVRLDAGGL